MKMGRDKRLLKAERTGRKCTKTESTTHYEKISVIVLLLSRLFPVVPVTASPLVLPTVAVPVPSPLAPDDPDPELGLPNPFNPLRLPSPTPPATVPGLGLGLGEVPTANRLPPSRLRLDSLVATVRVCVPGVVGEALLGASCVVEIFGASCEARLTVATRAGVWV